MFAMFSLLLAKAETVSFTVAYDGLATIISYMSIIYSIHSKKKVCSCLTPKTWDFPPAKDLFYRWLWFVIFVSEFRNFCCDFCYVVVQKFLFLRLVSYFHTPYFQQPWHNKCILINILNILRLALNGKVLPEVYASLSKYNWSYKFFSLAEETIFFWLTTNPLSFPLSKRSISCDTVFFFFSKPGTTTVTSGPALCHETAQGLASKQRASCLHVPMCVAFTTRLSLSLPAAPEMHLSLTLCLSTKFLPFKIVKRKRFLLKQTEEYQNQNRSCKSLVQVHMENTVSFLECFFVFFQITMTVRAFWKEIITIWNKSTSKSFYQNLFRSKESGYFALM